MNRNFTTRALACLAFGCSLVAQTFGDISGEVRDSSGAVIAGARVTITNTGTGGVRENFSNDAGLYAFPSLAPGTYNLRAEKQGFKAALSNNVQIQVQQSARLDLELQIGQVSESIEVSAAAAVLSTENATIGTVIENKRIVELPLNGRNYLQLVSLAPNVSFGFPNAGQAGSRQGGIRTEQSIAIGGQRAQFNRFTLDGVENTDPNFNAFIVQPSIDALQEFKVQTGVYPAEYGRSASQINVSTKPGGNDYHGTLFEFVRNDKFDAKNYAFTSARPPKDPFKWNQYGFTFSGPVYIPKVFNGKNKLFFMTNYEWFRQRRSVQSVYDLPLASMRSGSFNTAGVNPIFDPRTRAQQGTTVTANPFPNNTIPNSRFHPTSVKLLEFYPAANLESAGLRRNHQIARSLPIDRDQFVVRGDWVESSKSTWFGRYSWGDENQLTSQLFQNGDKIITNFDQYMVSNTRVLSPTMVNEARFGFTRFYNTTGPQLAFSRNVVGELAIPGLAPGPAVQWGIPAIGFAGVYSGFGNGSEGPYENNNRAIQAVNNLSLIRGKHTFKMGGEVRWDNYFQVGNQFARGEFLFNSDATRNPAVAGARGDAFADFLLGDIQQAEAAVSIANAKFQNTGFAVFFDDTWKITQKVTINWGLRYELTPPWKDATGTLFNGIVRNDVRPGDFRNAVVADRSQYPFFMRQGAASQDPYAGIRLRWPDIEVRQDGTLGDRLVAMDKNDFAPRFGISWNPSAKWVIRAGGGVFYNQDTGNPRFDMARNLAGRLRDNSNSLFPNLTWANGLAAIAGGVAQVPRPYTFANPYDRRTTYSTQYILNVQREFLGGTLFEAGYMGSVSHRLESLRAVNETVPAPRSTGLSLAQRSPFPNFGRIQLVDNGGNGNYNSLGAKLTKRYSSGITYLMSYTYAKSLDTATAIRNQGGDTLFPQNSYCRTCEYARSSHDTRHRFVTSALWDVPVGKGRKIDIENGFANAIIGGWQLGSIVTLQSGFPITVTVSGDPSNTGGQFDRPMATGAAVALDNGNPSQWFNWQAFTRPVDGTFGNVGRNTLNSPGIFGWDFSVLKNFPMGFSEKHNLQFRFEAFNFPNHPNWGNPNTNLASAIFPAGSLVPSSQGSFATITGTRTNMRNLQFALKYSF
ncbi:MAG: carboxypeptidase regulatory-like domain-containing protein [Acidobacteria bacterium]|nr:carboxypeptidase regulatory-like domain-containing protein [Acidobacteriota bacterium]